MKVIPLGLQCSVPDAIKKAGMRMYSYPLDWLWSPSKTTYHILSILIKEGVEKTVAYMTTGYTYYKYLGNEHYLSVDDVTISQMNKDSGLGNTHFPINDDYKIKLARRLERLLTDIQSGEDILFIYADAASHELNYYLDDIEYGTDANEYLLKIHDLIYPLNNHIKMVYFCWHERRGDADVIQYIPYDFKTHWHEVSELIQQYLLAAFVYA